MTKVSSTSWGSPIEIETRRRIRVSVWAYAYEILDSPMVDDETYDRECSLIDVRILTGNPKMDLFFQREFHSDTGMWIHKHPDQKGLEKYFNLWTQTEDD